LPLPALCIRCGEVLLQKPSPMSSAKMFEEIPVRVIKECCGFPDGWTRVITARNLGIQ
jgi:hypothetical protein